MYKTNQEVLNDVVAKMFEQKRQSVKDADDGQFCVYRSEDGYRCAIGLLIPDEKYNPKFDSEKNKNELGLEVVVWNPMKLLTEIGLIAEGAQVESFFLDDLQTCHDACVFSYGEPFWNEFSSHIVDICRDYDLDVPSQITVKD